MACVDSCFAASNWGPRLALLSLLLTPAAVWAQPSGADGAATGHTVRIELKERVRVSQPRLTLGDVANLTATDLQTLRALMAMPLGAAPRPGEPAWLSREDMQHWVSARAAPVRLDWRGPAEVTIERASQQLEGERLVLAARAALLSWLDRQHIRAQVQAISPARDLILPEGAVDLQVRPLPPGMAPAKRMQVWVDISVQGAFSRSATVSFEVDAWADAWVAEHDLARGTALDASAAPQFVRRTVDITTVRGVPAAMARDADATPGAPAPERLKRAVRSGDVLVQSNVGRGPVVERGSWAQLQTHSGTVSIDSRVEVLQNGSLGDVVRVKVPGAQGEVMARVTGPGALELQP